MKSFACLTVSLSACLALALSAETKAPRTFRFAGKVVDTEGRPVSGAVVELYGGTGLPLASAELGFQQRLTTGADGGFDFTFSGVPTEVIAHKPGLPPAWNYYARQARDLTDERLVFSTPSFLAGVVVDEADKPVADAEVWVSMAFAERTVDSGGNTLSMLNGKEAHLLFSTRTTADGKFRLEGFPSNGSADLAVTAPGKVLRAVKRPYTAPDTLFQAGQDDIKLVLEPAGSIEGKIVAEETGQPLPEARLSLQFNRPGYGGVTENEPAHSAADGTFRLADVAPGNYLLRASFGKGPLPDWVADTVPVAVEAGKTTRDVQLSAVKGGFLKVGALAKRSWRPLEEATITASKGAYHAASSADSNGIALFRLPPGEYHVFASVADSRAEGYSTTVESGQTNRLDIELTPPPTITGVVLDPGGKPAPGLKVSTFGALGPNAGEATTDATGRYEMPWAPQRFGGMGGPPCLMVRNPTRNLAAAQEVEEGATALDLRLEPGLVVAGRVEDSAGTPLTNATIRVFVQSGSMGLPLDNKPAKSDAHGHFEINCLPPGRQYNFWANAKGHGSAYQNVERDDSETNRVELPVFVLQVADQVLAGQVLDANDKAVAGARLYMNGLGQANHTTRSDRQGFFKFDEVCAGPVQVSASFQSAHGSTQAQSGDTNVVIHLGENSAFIARYGARAAESKRASLKGKPLPDLAMANLPAEAVPAGKPILLCLFDIEQRPSRRLIRSLAEQHDALTQKGVTVLGLQAAVISPDAYKEWKDGSSVPFPVGHFEAKADKLTWASEVESLPWLILTDKDHRVTAEGFSLDELESLLKAQGRD